MPMMFEVLQGDVFDKDGSKLVVFKLRVETTSGDTRVLVHYVEGDSVRIRQAAEFARMIGAGLDDGSIANVNRPADFGAF